jgi:hypothetical protein
MTTSFVWDVMRAAGNALLLLAFGVAILRVLRRFHARFAYAYTPLSPMPQSAQRMAFRPPPTIAPLEQQ